MDVILATQEFLARLPPAAHAPADLNWLVVADAGPVVLVKCSISVSGLIAWVAWEETATRPTILAATSFAATYIAGVATAMARTAVFIGGPGMGAVMALAGYRMEPSALYSFTPGVEPPEKPEIKKPAKKKRARKHGKKATRRTRGDSAHHDDGGEAGEP